jgi:multiple sugar transport system permease protein
VSPWRRAYSRPAAWFLLPALLLLAVFVVWPLLRCCWWSMHETDLLAIERKRWVGLSQYSDLLTDARFGQAFANTALFAVMVVPFQTLAALLLALWVNRPEAASRWLRVAFFVPTVIAMPVLAILWTMLYQPASGGTMGPVNTIITGLGFEAQAWLFDPGLALPALAFMSIWQGVGLQMMVFLAGLQAMAREPLEAALLDGANAFRRAWHVTLPALRNTIVFVLSVTTILAFRLFVQPYLMTRGGPEGVTRSVIQAIYELTFVSQDLGRACAGALIFLLTLGVVTLCTRRALREERP